MTDKEPMQAFQATPHEVLIAEIMDCRVFKTEREHAAAREIQKLRERLNQPEPEPVAWKYEGEYCYQYTDDLEVAEFNSQTTEKPQPLYTTPPKREWVGLTDDEIYEYADKFLYQHGSNYGIKSFGKAIEAKLKEKNT